MAQPGGLSSPSSRGALPARESGSLATPGLVSKPLESPSREAPAWDGGEPWLLCVEPQARPLSLGQAWQTERHGL